MSSAVRTAPVCPRASRASRALAVSRDGRETVCRRVLTIEFVRDVMEFIGDGVEFGRDGGCFRVRLA